MTYSHVRYAETGLVKEMRDDVRVVYGPSVNPSESRARDTLTATFLLAFAMLFAAALPAQAQTTIWSATLDPLVTFSGDPVPLGCDNTSGATWQCSNSDRLSDDDFTDDGMTYAVTKFFTKDGVLTFRLDTGATAATQGLTLVIDSEEFVLKEADRINGGKTQWKWNNTTLSWTAGTDVAVSLVVTDAPATGQPTISGAAQVSKTLTAATDDIEDLDGLPTTPTFTYQWVRVDGLTDTDIPGATSETYTLTASDLGKQIKVKVSVTDSRGHAEGPLTSGAYPPNNGTVVAAVGPCPAVNDWCATMTAAVDRDAVGYEYDKLGSLTDDQIEYGDEEFNVWTVHTQQEASRDYFYFGSIPQVPRGTVVTVGERTFTTDMESEDGTSDLWAYPPGELPPDLVWSDGQEVRVSLVLGSSAPTLSIADASAAENDGHLMFDVTLSPASPHTVKVDFETTSGGTATEGVDYWPHVYTHVIPYGETTTQMGFALIEDAVNAAGETVMVRLSNAREFDAYGNVIRVLNIATAEATGTITAPATTTTTTDVPGLTIEIQDATADEDDGYLDFKVRLSRKSTDLVCYDFETISGGTATEGTDYLKFPKATYWMQIGKRVDTPFVRIIDDSENDNGETVKVKISNAHLCDDASQTVSITRDEATGTIRNSDPLPQALMARFGRTAAVHVVEHVEERLAAPREVGVEAQVAGRQLRPGMERRYSAAEFLRVEHLQERREAVRAPIVRGRRQEQLVLEAGGEIANRPCQLRVDRVPRAAGGRRIVRLVQDEQGAPLKLSEPVTQRTGVGLASDEGLGDDEAAVGRPRVDAVASFLPLGGHVVAVVDHERQAEPLLHLVLPLPHDGGRTADDGTLDLLAQEHLPQDQPRLDGLPQPDRVGDEQIDPGHEQRLAEWLQLERLHLDTGLEEPRVGRGHAMPPQRVQVGREQVWFVESAAGDGLPVRAVNDSGVDLGVPEHLQLLAWRIVLDAGQAHERTVGGRARWRDALDEVVARPDADDLAGLEIHLVVIGCVWVRTDVTS